MEAGFNETEGPLHAKLMAAMQGANMVGADTRCTSEGTSSLSSFLRVALPEDEPDDFWLDLWVGATDDGVEPIDELQQMYDEYFATNIELHEKKSLKIHPNPAKDNIQITFTDNLPDEIRINSISGKTLLTKKVKPGVDALQIDVSALPKGVYVVQGWANQKIISTNKFLK
jgi:uncharacterized Ntn-hydrolase superfamily protein